MSIQDQIQVAEVNRERLLEWVNRFDNKSLVVLGLNAAMLGTLSAFVRTVFIAPTFQAPEVLLSVNDVVGAVEVLRNSFRVVVFFPTML